MAAVRIALLALLAQLAGSSGNGQQPAVVRLLPCSGQQLLPAEPLSARQPLLYVGAVQALSQTADRPAAAAAAGRRLLQWQQTEQDLWPRSTIFHNVYQQEGKPLFRHFTDHQLLQPILNLRPDYEVFSLELEQVMHPNKSDVYRYWSGAMTELGKPLVEAMRQLVPVAPNESQRRAWISSGGVIAGLHYDVFHNTFVMLRGSKRFTLLNPSALNKVKLHPSLHPGYRQSQLDDLFSILDAVSDGGEMWQVDLHPGDGMLCSGACKEADDDAKVEALQPGIAVNVWSLDARLERAETIFGLPVPFDEDWSVAERAHALGPFISGLIRNFTDESPRKWLDSYLPQRFAPQEALHGSWSKDTLPRGQCLCCDMAMVPSVEDIVARINTAVQRLQPLLRELDAVERGLYLQDYVEQLVSFILGPEYVVPLLTRCIRA